MKGLYVKKHSKGIRKIAKCNGNKNRYSVISKCSNGTINAISKLSDDILRNRFPLDKKLEKKLLNKKSKVFLSKLANGKTSISSRKKLINQSGRGVLNWLWEAAKKIVHLFS